MPRPKPLERSPAREGAAGAAEPAVQQEDVARAITQLLEAGGLSAEAIRSELSVLQQVRWQHRERHSEQDPRPQWTDLDPDDERALRMEQVWRDTLWIAVTEDAGGAVQAISRRSGLNIASHPFCSQTGERHPQIPPDFFNYRRVPRLPEAVKDIIRQRYLSELVQVLRRHHSNHEVCVFVTMVVTELTSPKIGIDANKSDFVQAGAIPVICGLLVEHKPVEVIVQNCCATLRNLLTNIPASEAFEREGYTQLLIDCVNAYPMNNELVHRACGCILIQASRGDVSRKALFAQGVVPCLVGVLQTPHGRMHMIRRLVVSTFQKLVKALDRERFREAMDKVRGFTLFNYLRGMSHDDDRPGIEEILSLRADLPRGTIVDPTVLVIDERGQFKREAILQIMKSNEKREYQDDPPTPKGAHRDWPAEQAASPLFPSQPSFGAADFDSDGGDDGKGHTPWRPSPTKVTATITRARTPGALTPQSSLPDVVLADDDLTQPMQTSSQITTPFTMNKIEELYHERVAASPELGGQSEAHRIARGCIDLLNSAFTPDGVFPRQPEFCKKLFNMGQHIVRAATAVLDRTPRGCQEVEAPCYVFGDIHGNFGDLQYFIKSLTVLNDILYTPYPFLFLGDYVDRGKWGPECIIYLLAYKVLAPHSFILLRGNHEDNDVCGDVALYGEGCFKTQIIQCFSKTVGVQESVELYNSIVRLFNIFTISAVIENKIFCSHGGIPRYTGGEDRRLATLRDPQFRAFSNFILPSPEQLTNAAMESSVELRQWVYAHDCIWSDPSAHGDRVDEFGFGRSCRGGQVISYGQQAVDAFLDATGLEFIIRGHEEKADGLNISKQARVLTVFTTSDYCGKGNRGGVALVRKLPNGDLLCRMIHRAKPLHQRSPYDHM